ncbi:DNA-binding transcriptional LysR family regulator [Aquamicrobium lusatiense]|uniref:DNA-binding transcriptional LysR family regulator n=1 Tax=Aquamicrobium lusatiense TaxID=89772 RepID=A0A7W9S5Z1_9HYPH|nr:LysR substrate-binding domain-containing protein [Aquamicrobium lusatiense]MBB6014726.1 DNA-binding transcriptional LysR family regulator [Aquamicrobium lusatiense]
MAQRPRANNLELRHLRYFLAVAEAMNFGQAADRLNIAQPGLSQQIKMLEQIIGVVLFDRSRRQLRMTLAGELFLPEVQKIFAQVEHGVQTAQRAGRGEIGRLAIGYVGSAAYTGALTRLVGTFRKTHPYINLDIAEMEMLRQLDAIAQGVLDVGFIRPPVPLPEGVASVTVMREELMIVLPHSHPRAQQPVIFFGDLQEETFITPQHPHLVSFNAHTIEAGREAGFEPRIGAQGRDFMTIASMVSVGLGIALVPQSVQCIQLPNVVYRPLSGTTPLAELAVAYRRGDASAAVRHFISLARKIARIMHEEQAAAASQAGSSSDG